MPKQKLTAQDFTDNPELHAMGYQVGDEVEIPKPELKETPNDSKNISDETGGSNPPPDKPRDP